MKLDRRTRRHLQLQNAIFTLLLLALVVLAAWLSQTWRHTADWTLAGRHTISEESREIIALFAEPIAVTAWVGPDPATRDAIDILVERYRRAGADIELEYINPERNPALARERGIRPGGELIIHYDGREQRLQRVSEVALSNALARLSLHGERWVVFLQGHGERDPLGHANHDLGNFARRLMDRGFNVQTLDLAEIPGIPGNTDLLVIAGPRADYPAEQLRQVMAYLDDGGNLLWLTDPDDPARLRALAERLAIERLPGVVIDPAAARAGIDNPEFAVVSDFGEHPVTRGLTGFVLLPQSGALRTDTDEDRYRPLLRTGPGAHRTGHQASGTGGLLLGVASRPGDAGDQRIAVIGDGDFLANAFVGHGVNLELGMRLFHWLGGDEDRMHIPPSRPHAGEIHLSPAAGAIIGLGFLLAIPALMLFAGFTIWWRRRRN